MTGKRTNTNSVSAFISAIYSTPIDCPGCGEHAHLMRREVASAGMEMRSFECVSCRLKTELMVPA
jgi:hypothetical protein